MMAQKLLPECRKIWIWMSLGRIRCVCVHDCTNTLIFLFLLLSHSELRLRYASMLLMCVCVYESFARKRIVTRLQAIWSLIYVLFLALRLFHPNKKKKHTNYFQTNTNAQHECGTNKRKTISMHNGKRILFKMMTSENDTVDINAGASLVRPIEWNECSCWRWCLISKLSYLRFRCKNLLQLRRQTSKKLTNIERVERQKRVWTTAHKSMCVNGNLIAFCSILPPRICCQLLNWLLKMLSELFLRWRRWCSHVIKSFEMCIIFSFERVFRSIQDKCCVNCIFCRRIFLSFDRHRMQSNHVFP